MQDNNEVLQRAALLAATGRFAEFVAITMQLAESVDLSTLLNVGGLLSSYGFLTEARTVYEKVQSIAPNDLRSKINLAKLSQDVGEHYVARNLYSQLVQALPRHPLIRRSALASLEYDPSVTDVERLKQAKAWGEWAVVQAGGERPRLALKKYNANPLRIGYVSADLCQHTLGLFVKDVLKAHNPDRVKVFAYNAGSLNDWVTLEISSACTLREVAKLSDGALSNQIRSDNIDVLIDLSGHTAGSRLTAFAYRPAPVLVSWLGYFATTGLRYIDAVLLDEWHAPPGIEMQFVEPILRLPAGRFCYQPVPWAPAEVTLPPVLRTGNITFGCFNNTAKLNPHVFDVWGRVLTEVPNARLILKWRTFNDKAFREQVTNAFVQRGIESERIELRGPSFHADLLKEYSDIDIALDPFPFTGGLTSCEALWMGVPVVTWPQSRVVSRQTHALLHQIGLPELSAHDVSDYVRIAVELANDNVRLVHLRTTLRDRMRTSSLMDVAGFTCQLENSLIDLYRHFSRKKYI